MIKLFRNHRFGTIRTIIIDGVLHFYANDVARRLEYMKPNNAVNRHCKHIRKISCPETGQLYNVILLPDVSRLVMRSNLPDAILFQNWIVEDVIPSIYHIGAYILPSKIEELRNSPEKIEYLLREVEESKYKAAFVDLVAESEGSMYVREFGNMIKIGEKKLYKWLRETGQVYKKGTENTPTNEATSRGLLEHVQYERITKRGNISSYFVTKVTGKGVVYYSEKLLKQGLISQ